MFTAFLAQFNNDAHLSSCPSVRLGHVSKYCWTLSQQLKEIVGLVLRFANDDPHPRVRYAAINALGQLSNDQGPRLQNEHHAGVVGALLRALDDARVPRVQAHAAAAVINFCEMCEPEVIEPYLEALLSKLFARLREGVRFVQEQAISAVASLADCSEHLFTRFYDTFMPALKNVLETNSVSV